MGGPTHVNPPADDAKVDEMDKQLEPAAAPAPVPEAIVPEAVNSPAPAPAPTNVEAE